MSNKETVDPVARLLSAIEQADGTTGSAFAEDAVLDATVPGWRFTVEGSDPIGAKLNTWYADVGRFEELERIPIPGGEIVRFFLSWEENGIPHACHQAHVLVVADGMIRRDTVFCGGRWPASRLAEMEEAAHSH